jgi:V/A-type H+-transporting ATPase subunit C
LAQTARYAGVLAKIGVERSRLLSENKLKELTASTSLDQLAAKLRETSYVAQLVKVQSPLTSRKLERAFQETFIETCVKIAKHSPKRVARFLRLYLLRFEVENIKALVKATNAKLGGDEKLAKVYLSVEDYFKKRAVFEDAAKASTLKQLVTAFKNTEYASALGLGLRKFDENTSTTCFDVLLDHVFYEELHEAFQKLPKMEKPHAFYYASLDNDKVTLLTLLRGKNLNYDPNWLRLAVPEFNFNISRETIEAMVTAANFAAALTSVPKSHYATFFAKAQTPEETLSAAEKAFQKAVFEYAKDHRIRELFNIGAPLAFITQKEAEVHNLTLISLGIEAGWKPEDIESQLLT